MAVAADAPRDDSTVLEADAAAVSPARRRAERDLLAILIHSPSLRAQTVPAEGRGLVSVTNRFKVDAFRDPALHRVAEVVLGRLEADADFTVQDLMGELDSPAHRRLVSDLYEQAQVQGDRAGPGAAEQLQAACAALTLVEQRERYQEEVAEYHRQAKGVGDADALRKRIEQRRKQGDLPAAMPLRVRS